MHYTLEEKAADSDFEALRALRDSARQKLLAARNLRADILGLPPRFVLIVDESLTRRGVLKYSAGRSSVSPLDLLASIDAFRRSSTPAPASSPKRRIWQSAAA